MLFNLLRYSRHDNVRDPLREEQNLLKDITDIHPRILIASCNIKHAQTMYTHTPK